jgi:hypothetical protein
MPKSRIGLLKLTQYVSLNLAQLSSSLLIVFSKDIPKPETQSLILLSHYWQLLHCLCLEPVAAK